MSYLGLTLDSSTLDTHLTAYVHHPSRPRTRLPPPPDCTIRIPISHFLGWIVLYNRAHQHVGESGIGMETLVLFFFNKIICLYHTSLSPKYCYIVHAYRCVSWLLGTPFWYHFNVTVSCCNETISICFLLYW